MLRVLLLILTWICFLTKSVYGQKFDTLTSRVFFNVDIKSKDTTLLSYFRARAELTPKKDTGWTMYPPTNEKGEALPYFKFVFTRHPYFTRKFQDGRMEVITSAQKDKVLGMTLGFDFTSEKEFIEVYNNLISLYTRCADRVIKRKVAPPFEVTKFIAQNKTDFVIITKGEITEDGGKPYVHVAYNFQDYVW